MDNLTGIWRQGRDIFGAPRFNLINSINEYKSSQVCIVQATILDICQRR